MRPRFIRFFAVLLVFALVPISFVPQAAADYSWTQITSFELGDSATSAHLVLGEYYGDTIALGDTILALAVVGANPSTTTPVVYRCTTTSCPSNSGIGALSGMRAAHISRLDAASPSTAYGCASPASSGGIAFSKTSNAGAQWSVTTFSATDSKSCDVASFDGSHYAMVWANGTTDDWVVTMSSDGGATWPVTYLVEAESGSLEADGVAVAAFSDTDYITLIWDVDTGNFNQCKTTNSGVAWSCTQGVIAGARVIQKERFGNTWYFSWNALGAVGSDFAGFGTLASINDIVAGTNAYSVSDSNTAVCTSDVGIFSTSRVAVSLVLCNEGANTPTFLLSESLDSGATWDVQTIFTIPCHGVTDSSFNTGVAYNTAGTIFAQVQAQSNDDNGDNTCGSGADDGDANGERFFWAFVSSGAEAPSTGVKATAAVTNLVGFDVDPTGSRAVARTSGGDIVSIWGAKNLGTAETVETNCDLGFKEDGVAAKYGGELVMFLNCDALGDPQYMSIRDPGGDIPTASELGNCEPGSGTDQCPYDITISDWPEPFASSLGQLAQIKEFPVDYSNIVDIPAYDARRLAWAFNTQDPNPGEVGIATFSRNEPGIADTHGQATVGFSATQAEDFCVGLDGEQYYLAAADTSESVKTWPVNFDSTNFPQHKVNPSIGGVTPFGVSGAYAIDCGGGQIAFVAGNSLYYATRSGNVIDSYDLGSDGGVGRGVAISEEYDENGEPCTDAVTNADCHQAIVVYKDDTAKILVFRAEDDELNHTGTLDVTIDGSVKELEMDRIANGAWLAQTGQVDYYEIFNFTNQGDQVGNPCVINCGDGPGDTPTPGEELFGGAGASIGSAFGLDVTAGNAILGIIIMICLAAAGVGLFREAPIAGGLVGGVVGFAFGATALLFSQELVFLVVAGVVALIVLGLKR